MEKKSAQTVVISVVVAALIGLAAYSQSGIDPESSGLQRTQGLKALIGGYGHATAGSDPAIIMTPGEDW